MTDAIGPADAMRGPAALANEVASVRVPVAPLQQAWSWLASDRGASWAFRIHLAVGWLLIVFRYGPRRWFLVEDWFLLAGRDGGSVGSIFAPYQEHVVAFDVVVYRLLFNTFGLRYSPFVVVVVTLDVVLVVVVRALLRHLGVSAWTSTVAAGVLLGLGIDAEPSMPFQSGWVVALSVALLQLLIADRSGPFDRRDAAGMLLGIVAILSASIAALVIVTTGIVCAVRRGWVAAAAHTIPALVAYQLWALVTGPSAPTSVGRPSIETSLDWLVDGVTRPLDAISQNGTLSAVLAAVTAVGLFLAAISEPPGWWRRNLVALTLLAMSPVMYFAIGQGRWQLGPIYASAPHLVAVGLVFLMPAIATAIDVLVRSSRRPYFLAILVVGVPAHVRWLEHPPFLDRFDHERQLIVAIAHDPRLADLPSSYRLLSGPFGPATVTAGWLRDVLDRGALTDGAPTSIDPGFANELTIRLSLDQRVDELPLGTGAPACPAHDGPLDLELRRGDSIELRGPVNLTTLERGSATSPPVPYTTPERTILTLVVISDELSVRMSSGVTGFPFQACVQV